MSRPPQPAVRDRRRLLRRQVEIAAEISGSILPRRRKVIMTDISALGCRVQMPGRFNRGDTLLVSVPSFGPFGARVVWSIEGELGLGFVRPLHSAVVNHVVRLRTRIDCPIERRWRAAALAGPGG